VSTQADHAREHAEELLSESMTEEGGYADRCVARAQVWATLSISYELAGRGPA
jgi:hypothetical protein